jgi:ferredoxin
MKVIINEKNCVGCAACVATCPNIFDFNDDGFAYVKNPDVPEENENEVKDLEKTCLGNAITTK